MKRLGIWGLSVALIAGTGATAFADPPTMRAGQTTLMDKFLSLTTPKRTGPTVASDPQRAMSITAPLPPEVVADAVRAEQDAYLRRVSICTELRRVAAQQGNDTLTRQADELERQAAALYNLRVTRLGVSYAKAPLPETASGKTNLVPLDQPTDPVAKSRRLETPGAARTESAKVWEVRP